MIKYKFKRKEQDDFWSTLRQRVNNHFKENEIEKDANIQMVIKTIALFTIYLAPFFVLLFSGMTDTAILIMLWVIMGLGKAFIGMSVMHDSVHGAYSRSKAYNSLVMFSAALIGVDRLIWKISHNVIHHTYTNIEETDEDILPRYFFRFSEHQPKKWFHRFQYIYAPIFYCVPLLEWITTKDFLKAFEYKKMNIIKPGVEFRREFAGIVGRKIMYYIVFLALPMYLIDISPWITLGMILASHAVTGIMLSLIFQTAHVVPNAEFVKAESENIDTCWATHQLMTTSNYGMTNKILTWFVGGLNYQIEHHLFPDICHVHYPKIAKIVQDTSKEFDLPYHSYPSFRSAVAEHFGMLKELGR